MLDNCEHLLAACAQLVAAILAGCPGVDVLATSREPLHAHGEYTFRVPSLALPSTELGTGSPDLAELGRAAECAALRRASSAGPAGFRARRRATRRGWSTCADGSTGCPWPWSWRRPGRPSSNRRKSFQRLGDALSLLGGGSTAITRHQTLRGTLEWSHDLLTEPEQVLLRRLSVFSGGFTLEAMEAVCGAPPLEPIGLFDLLAKLVDKSLVVAEKTAAGTRYRQLETVRQFGSENLDRAGETGQLSAAHGAYFLAFAVAHNPERAMGVVIEQPKLLDREHDNLRAALRWACAHDPETALRLVASLWRFWFVRGHAVEGARWVERALAVAPGPDPAPRGRPDRPHRIGQPPRPQRSASSAWGGGDGDRAADRRAGRGGDGPDHRGHAGLEHVRSGRSRTDGRRRAGRGASSEDDPNTPPPAAGCSASARCSVRMGPSPSGASTPA